MSRIVMVLAAALVSCMPVGGPGMVPVRDDEPAPRRRPPPMPDPLTGIALSDSQRVAVDSIRASYWLQVKDMDGPDPGTFDEFANLVKRERVDERLVLTREQRALYDRHVAENRAHARRAEEPDH